MSPNSSNSQKPTILLCDDEDTFRLAISYSLKGDYRVLNAKNPKEALTIIKATPIDLLLLDVHFEGSPEGLEGLHALREADPDLMIVVLSGATDYTLIRKAMIEGARDYLRKDLSPEELLHSVANLLDQKRLQRAKEQQTTEVELARKRHPLLGNHISITRLKEKTERARKSRANVVIIGETGTGKEIIARALRAQKEDGSVEPFIAVDSATLQSSTAESILFGYEKGAFTGADKVTRGLFEEANDGIIYFDEIANMPLNIQAKLLRVLQEKEVLRLGSTKPIPLNFRVVCATNRTLDGMVANGEFKADLLQRLAVIPLQTPPLRERIEDVPILFNHFLKLEFGAKTPTLSEEAAEALNAYSWPGNVRELKNLVSYLHVFLEGPIVKLEHLPEKLQTPGGRLAKDPTPAKALESFYDHVAAFEAGFLRAAYQRNSGNISKLATQLKMDRSHLYTKLKAFGIHDRSAAAEFT